jgi:hypothetical protein
VCFCGVVVLLFHAVRLLLPCVVFFRHFRGRCETNVKPGFNQVSFTVSITRHVLCDVALKPFQTVTHEKKVSFFFFLVVVRVSGETWPFFLVSF